jgi:hypothetical protein
MANREARSVRRTGGISLVETTIALVVLSVGILGMLAAQITALHQSNQGRHHTAAAQIARDQTELLMRLPWTDPAVLPTGVWSLPRATTTLVDGDPAQPGMVEQTFNVSWRVSPGATLNLRLIDVRVNWTEDTQGGAAANRQFVMSTLKVQS